MNRASFVPDDSTQVYQPREAIIEDVSYGLGEETYRKKELNKLYGDDPFASIPFSALSKNDKRKAQRLIKRFEGEGGEARSKYLSVEQINGYMLYKLASPPYNLDYLAFLGVEDPTNHACVMVKSYNIVGGGYHWKETIKIQMAKQLARQVDEVDEQQKQYEQQKALAEHQAEQANAAKVDPITGNTKGDVKPPPIPEPPDSVEKSSVQKLTERLIRAKQRLDDKVDSFNMEESLSDTLLKVWIDVETMGNGYIEIGRNNNGEIGYVGHIPAQTMRVRIDRDGFVQWVLPGYVGPQPMGLAGPYPGLTFFRNFGDRTTPDIFSKDPNPNEVIHIKKHTTKSTYYGVPDIIPAIASVVGDKFAREYNLDYFENKAVPRYALIVKGAKLSAQAEKKILDYFRKEVKGRHHGTLYIPVPASIGGNVDVELTPIENQMQEGSFHQFREDNRHEICMAHRVPSSKLGLGGNGSHQAAVREDNKTFEEQVINPEQKRLAWKINKIIKEFTDMFELEFNEYELDDEETRSRIHDRYVRLGVYSPNDIREKLNEMPRKGGDGFLDPTMQSGGDVNLDTDGISKPGGGPPSTMPTRPQGRPRQTTDGSPKNPNPNRTPADKTTTGRATQGSKQN